jgi:hypothetical protein
MLLDDLQVSINGTVLEAILLDLQFSPDLLVLSSTKPVPALTEPANLDIYHKPSNTHILSAQWLPHGWGVVTSEGVLAFVYRGQIDSVKTQADASIS